MSGASYRPRSRKHHKSNKDLTGFLRDPHRGKALVSWRRVGELGSEEPARPWPCSKSTAGHTQNTQEVWGTAGLLRIAQRHGYHDQCSGPFLETRARILYRLHVPDESENNRATTFFPRTN